MKNTIKILREIAYRHHIHNVFTDFLEQTVAAFSMGRSEKTYMQAIERYNKSELPLFGQALGAMMQEYDKGSDNAGAWVDVIGNVFEEIELTNSAAGQFFTPKAICDMMAQITDNGGSEDGLVSDPSAGSGRNLIAHSRINSSYRTQYDYIAQDLDRRCCLMSVINFVLYGLRGYVIHSNTLSMETYGGWRVFLPETGLGVMPMSKVECQAVLNSEKVVNQQKQQTLF